MTSLYVHVPFCLKKCNYCAFYSVSLDQSLSTGSERVSAYLDGLEREIALRINEAPEQGVSSLFIGGGTPTALDIHGLDRLLGLLHKDYRFPKPEDASGEFTTDKMAAQSDEVKDKTGVKKDIEKTVESNPGTLDLEKLLLMRNHGINRISLGAQCFDDQILKRIGRIHSSQDIYRGVELIRKAGIESLNLDLMFGLPGQMMTGWQDSLQQAVALNPEHLSLYALTIEEGTPLYKEYLSGESTFSDDDTQADMYEWAAAYLHSKGYAHYEVSNFAKPSFECRHNLAYWRSEEYIGLGPGAVSCLGGVRSKNLENTTMYQHMLASGKRPVDDSSTEVLTTDQRISEYMMLGLRTLEGIGLKEFAEKFHTEVQNIYGQTVSNYLNKGILQISDARLKINPSYLFVLNSVLLDFILS